MQSYQKKKKRRTSRKPRKGKPLRRVEHFHRRKRLIPKTVFDVMDPHEIIYGARALNKRFPNFLDRHTEDWDIFTPTPRKDARELEQALDRRFGGDYFYVKPALHKGTYKVVAHATEEGYADYTRPDETIPYNTIGGRRYVKLCWVKRRIRKTLRDPKSEYRHDKDRDALNRILIFEQMKKNRR